MGKGSRRKELQCHECEGYGHFRNECPLTKRKELKCIDCKGYGHTRSECPNNLKKDKSLVCFSDTESESDSDNDELHLNFVAMVGETADSDPLSITDSESEDDFEEDKGNEKLKTEFRSLFDKFTELSLENLQLIKDRAMLRAQVNILELKRTEPKVEEILELEPSEQEMEDAESSAKLTTDQLNSSTTTSDGANCLTQLQNQLDQAKQLLSEELDKNRLMQHELRENHKKIRMLNSGSKTLDHILTLGQSPSVSRGLGFQERSPQTMKYPGEIKFVKGHDPAITGKTKQINSITAPHGRKTANTRINGCHFCCKPGHRVTNCYFRKDQYRRAWTMSRCFMEPKKIGYVWVAKTDLYPNYRSKTQGHIVSQSMVQEYSSTAQRPGKEIVCNMTLVQKCALTRVDNVSPTEIDGSVNIRSEPPVWSDHLANIIGNVAYTSSERENLSEISWYFDSGCSRHMTGKLECLEEVKRIKGGKVTFGDGAKAKIRGIGK